MVPNSAIGEQINLAWIFVEFCFLIGPIISLFLGLALAEGEN